MSFYRSIIRQAFSITWQFKYLWFFGLFATLLASNFEIEFINRFLNQGTNTIYGWQNLLSYKSWSGLIELIRIDFTSFIGVLILLVVLVILAIAIIWLSVVSQVALINNGNKIFGNIRKASPERKHDVSIGFKEGKRYFWPVLFLNIVIRIVVYALALATIAPFIIWSTSKGIVFSLIYLIIFIVFFSFALSLALMARYAIATVIIKGKSFVEAIQYGWNLFWDNWLVSLEMAFILFAISLLGTFLILISVLIVAIPFIILYVVTLMIGFYPLWILMLTLTILLMTAIVVIGGSMVTVFQTVTWVGLYNQLIGQGATSKLERMFGREA